jgi:hypothetical protein
MSVFGWSLVSQMFAAYSKTFRRCWPSVVPLLPPTGAVGVGSLKPSPGPSVLTTMIWPWAKTGAAGGI